MRLSIQSSHKWRLVTFAVSNEQSPLIYTLEVFAFSVGRLCLVIERSHNPKMM